MSRIFLSHSSKDNDSAVALRDWLAAQGWDDVFLDLEPQRGIAAGDRWERSLNQAALRCEAVLFLVSRAWLASDWCLKEFNLAHRLNKRLFGLLIEDIPIGELPATLTGTWQLVPLASGRDHVMLRVILPGSQDEAHVTFSQEGLTRLRVGLERAGLDARFFTWPPQNDPRRPPYRGLLPLEATDAGIFFGREAPIIQALDRIRGMKDGAAPRLLVLLGASGAGKSSFLRAGLLPRLSRDDRNFLTLPVIRPEKAAINSESGLLRSLEAAFAMHDVIVPRADIRAAITGGAATLRPLLQTLIARVRTTLVADDDDTRPPVLVLAIDQGEELFQTDGAAESAVLLNLLRELLSEDTPALLVVITIRSDVYEQLQTAKPLEGLTQTPLSLIPMPRGAYQSVIEGPAARLKETDRPLAIEPALTQALLSDIEDGGGRDALPLLAFTLERLYLEYGARGRLTLNDYDALGRIKGSIEAAVERAFRAADNDARIPRDHDARLSLLRRGLIPWLAGIDPDTGSPRRQKARISEIPKEAGPLIDLLVEQRLLSTDVADGTGERTIEPAHESLLRQWGSLQSWLQEDFAALTTLETVKRSARDWDANAKGEDWLSHRAGRLEDAERLLQRPDLASGLGFTDRAYLAECKQREETERKERTAALERRLKLTRRFSVATALAAIIMAGVGLYAYTQKSKAEAATQLADASTATAKDNLEQSERNLEQARVNQGHFLSRESTLALARNDPVTAIGLALEALPTEESNETPYVPDAEAALFVGLSALRERHVLGGHTDQVVTVALDTKGSRIVTASNDKTARVWDAVTGKQLAVLYGHNNSLSNAKFSPDGSRIVTVAKSEAARIWDAATGRQLAVLEGHSEGVLEARFSPDGLRVVTASEDRTARIWDAVTGSQLVVLQGHNGKLLDAAFSPDGLQIITASEDRTARIWDAVTGKPFATLKGHDNTVFSAAFSPDGSRVVTGSSDQTARLWYVATGRQLAQLDGSWWSKDEAGLRAAFSRDGSRIITVSLSWRSMIRIWDGATGQQLAQLDDPQGAHSANFSADGLRVVTPSDDNTVRVWDAVTGKQLALLSGHTNAVRSAVFSPDGLRIVTASADKTARIWNASAAPRIIVLNANDHSEMSVVKSAIAGMPTNKLATFSADDARVVTSFGDDTPKVWNAGTGQLVATLEGHSDEARSAIFSPDGSRIVTASEDMTARIWDAATGRQLVLLKGHKAPASSAAYSPDGLRVVTASEDKTARVWDALTGRQLVTLEGHGDFLFGAIFSPDGSRIATASQDKTARIWDSLTGKQLLQLEGHDGPVLRAIFSLDGSRIVTVSRDSTARIWNASTGQELSLLRHRATVHNAAFSPDGLRLVTASSDSITRVWDVATGRQILILDGQTGRILDAAFSPDGSRIVTASSDYTARIWDAATGKPVAVLKGHEHEVDGAAFNSDGSRVVTVSADGTARVWIVERNTTELIKTARELVPRCLASNSVRTSY